MSLARLIRFGAVMVALATARAEAQNVVTLRESAELPGAGPVVLAQIADITGPGAESLATTEVVPAAATDASGWAAIEVAAVRAALAARSDVNLGRLVVRGSTCAVRRARPEPRSERAAPLVTGQPGPVGPTIRLLVEQRVREALGVDEADLRMTFEPADATLLDTPVAGRSADVQLVGTSDRQAVSIKLYEGLRQAVSGTARVGVLVRRDVAVCATPLRRGDAITPAAYTVEERWIAPTARPVDPDRAAGRVARGRVEAGEILEEKDAEAPLAVKKGELVDIYCLSNSINLKSVARALDGGREGETIRFQTPNASRSFLARIDGPGRAVTGVGLLAGADADEPVAAVPEREPPRASAPESVKKPPRARYAELANRPVARAQPGSNKERTP